MAESRTRRGSSANSNSNSSRKSVSAREAIDRVREELPELLGRPIEAVLGLESDDEAAWKVTVQVVELARIPHSTDVLGSYTVTLDREGALTGYKRDQRYYRNQTDGE